MSFIELNSDHRVHFLHSFTKKNHYIKSFELGSRPTSYKINRDYKTFDSAQKYWKNAKKGKGTGLCNDHEVQW